MGKMLCRCGYVFDLTPSPEPFTWIAIRDADYERLLRTEAESEALSREYERHRERVTALDQAVYEMWSLVYNCPVCHRIYWYRGEDGVAEVFVPEAEPPAA